MVFFSLPPSLRILRQVLRESAIGHGQEGLPRDEKLRFVCVGDR